MFSGRRGGGVRASVAPPCLRRQTVADVNQLLFVMKWFLFPVGNSSLALHPLMWPRSPTHTHASSFEEPPALDVTFGNPRMRSELSSLFKPQKNPIKNVRVTRTSVCLHHRVVARPLPRRSARWSARSSC